MTNPTHTAIIKAALDLHQAYRQAEKRRAAGEYGVGKEESLRKQARERFEAVLKEKM